MFETVSGNRFGFQRGFDPSRRGRATTRISFLCGSARGGRGVAPREVRLLHLELAHPLHRTRTTPAETQTAELQPSCRHTSCNSMVVLSLTENSATPSTELCPPLGEFQFALTVQLGSQAETETQFHFAFQFRCRFDGTQERGGLPETSPGRWVRLGRFYRWGTSLPCPLVGPAYCCQG